MLTQNNKVRKEIAKELGLNVSEVPKIYKVTLNVGIGSHKDSKEDCQKIESELALISGQKPRFTCAKKSISGFKTREGERVGYSVTLRNGKMWDFISRFINIVLPRLRDFDGISSKNFDKSMNFTYPVREQAIFPEINPNEIKFSWGMAISFSLKNSKDKQMVENYLKRLGFVLK
ncbi:MAG: 50S ribosomal protein L5 [Candidatus Berkelbacteria bacterium]|nr:50S ribosomal protein L5 [Candidatus Berkelbacteria bacterium]